MPSRRTALTTLVLAAGALAAPPAAPAATLGSRTLEPGDRGRDVRQLQVALRRVDAGRLRPDGAFGPRTRSAVVRYERRHRMLVDGRVSTGQARGLLRRARMPVPPPVAADGSAAEPATGGPGTVFPVRGDVTWGDGFGDRGGEHRGVDLMSDCGTTVVAVTASTVRVRDSGGAAGNHLVLTTSSGEEHVYMHLQEMTAQKGDAIPAGGPLGTVGRTGNATACHLHFEQWTAPGWYAGGHAVDPAPLLRGAARPGA